jgi:hypothetical protein
MCELLEPAIVWRTCAREAAGNAFGARFSAIFARYSVVWNPSTVWVPTLVTPPEVARK